MRTLFLLMVVAQAMVFMCGCSVWGTIKVKGVKPTYPYTSYMDAPTMVAENEPVFIWQGKKGNAYDFIIWQAARNEEGEFNRGKVLHTKTDIRGNTYKLPIALRKGYYYAWSIKATSASEWSHWDSDIGGAIAAPTVTQTGFGMDKQSHLAANTRTATLKDSRIGFIFYVPQETEVAPFCLK